MGVLVDWGYKYLFGPASMHKLLLTCAVATYESFRLGIPNQGTPLPSAVARVLAHWNFDLTTCNSTAVATHSVRAGAQAHQFTEGTESVHSTLPCLGPGRSATASSTFRALDSCCHRCSMLPVRPMDILSMPGEMPAALSSAADSSELVDAAEQLISVSKYLQPRGGLVSIAACAIAMLQAQRGQALFAPVGKVQQSQ